MGAFLIGLILGGVGGFFTAAFCAAVSLSNRRYRRVKCGKCGNEFIIDTEGDYSGE